MAEEIIEDQAVAGPSTRFAVISAGVVVNTIVAPEGYELEGYELVASDTARIGQLYVDGEFNDAPPAPLPVPDEISDRQFFHALALTGEISEAEALAAVKTGDPPAAMEAFLVSLPAEDQFNARMLLEGAVTFRRSHALTEAFAAGMNMTAEQTDDLWRLAASL